MPAGRIERLADRAIALVAGEAAQDSWHGSVSVESIWRTAQASSSAFELVVDLLPLGLGDRAACGRRREQSRQRPPCQLGQPRPHGVVGAQLAEPLWARAKTSWKTSSASCWGSRKACVAIA